MLEKTVSKSYLEKPRSHMISKEQIKAEIEGVPDDRLEDLYSIIKTYSKCQRQPNGRSLMSKLSEIAIDGPEDFAENVDLYLTGEKTFA
jgi:hypothetical protein